MQLEVSKFVKFTYIKDLHPLNKLAIDTTLDELKCDKSAKVIFEYL